MVSKFFKLDRVSRKLLLIASFLEISFWFLLRLLPFRAVRAIMEKLVTGVGFFQLAGGETMPRLIWALSIASRRLLGKDTCLPQAMAARVLFGWSGYPAEIKFGVKKTSSGKLQAHAWVLHKGQVLIGGEGLDLTSYTPLNHMRRSLL